MNASSLSFRSAVVLAIAGMVYGIIMAASQNHAPMPAHAHLNLIGWVSLFLIGIYYRYDPRLDASLAARVQVLVWIAGTVILTVGVSLISLGYVEYEPLAIVGSLIVLAAMLIFAYLVFRPQRAPVGAMSEAPAE